MNQTKTNAMRELERAGIEYKHYTYDPNETEGIKVAALVGRPQERVFKTLVTESPKRVHYVFVIPVAQTVSAYFIILTEPQSHSECPNTKPAN